MSKVQENSTMEAARAAVYSLLAALLTQNLSSENLQRLLSNESIGHLKALFPDEDIDDAFRQLIDDYEAGVLTAENIMLDFEALMRIPGPAYTYPYESSYRSRKIDNDRVRWGYFNGQQAGEVQRFYQDESLAVENDSADFPDHIGVEMEFMAHLCCKLAAALNSGNRKTAEEVQATQVEFFRGHLCCWLDAFAAEMRKKATTGFYRCLGDILMAFKAEEERILVSEAA